MKKALEITFRVLFVLLMVILMFSVIMYLVTAGSYSVPLTVEDDKSLPHIEINNVVFHAEMHIIKDAGHTMFGEKIRESLKIISQYFEEEE